MGQICLSIIFVASLIHYKLQFVILNLGQILSHLIIYIDTQKTPNELINVMGLFTMKKSYYPWLVAIVTIILNHSGGGLLDANNIFQFTVSMDLYCGYWIRTFLVDGKGCFIIINSL